MLKDLEGFNARRAVIGIGYNGKNVQTNLCDYLESFTYVDVASGDGDTIEIDFENIDMRWFNEWMPEKTDTLEAQIKTWGWTEYKDDWYAEDIGEEIFKCGTFLLDDFSFSGRPLVCTIRGISTPLNSVFKATKRTKTWKEMSIEGIAKEIAKRSGISCTYEAEVIKIGTLEQNKETDSEFLAKLCKDYGLYMKIYSNKIIIYNPAKYDAKPSVVTLVETIEPDDPEANDKLEIKEWSWNTTVEGTYTGGKIEYTDAKKETDYTCTIGTGPRILDVSGKAESLFDAQRKVVSGVNIANRGTTTMSITLMGTYKIVATNCVDVEGLGKLDGKYFVDKVTHKVGSSYEVELELSKVETQINDKVKTTSKENEKCTEKKRKKAEKEAKKKAKKEAKKTNKKLSNKTAINKEETDTKK